MPTFEVYTPPKNYDDGDYVQFELALDEDGDIVLIARDNSGVESELFFISHNGGVLYRYHTPVNEQVVGILYNQNGEISIDEVDPNPDEDKDA